jgi:hypothetical protein
VSSWVGGQLLLQQVAWVKTKERHAFSLVWNLLFFRNHLYCLMNAKGYDLACGKELTHILVLLFSQNVPESIDSFYLMSIYQQRVATCIKNHLFHENKIGLRMVQNRGMVLKKVFAPDEDIYITWHRFI